MADRRELLDYTHALAHYINRGLPVQWEGTREGAQSLLTFTVGGDRFWRVVSETQDIRDAVRRGRYPGVLLTDRPITLEQPALYDLTVAVLDEYGVEKPEEMIGRDCLGPR